MKTTTNNLTIDECCSLSAWDIAERLGLGYSGDCNCLEHGGYFYSKSNWTDYGYASAVEFWHEGDILHVTRGAIYKKDECITDEAIADCYGSDYSPNGEELAAGCFSRSMELEVDMCRSQWGIEPRDGAQPKPFNLEAWKEERIWKIVLPHLVALAAE